MNVLIFSKLFYPHGSGAELATWLHSKLLAQNGFKIAVITKQFPNEPSTELPAENISIHRIPMKFFGSRYDTLANIGIMGKSFISRLIAQSDLVYVPTDWYSAIPTAKIHRKPVLVHLHNYSIISPSSLIYDFCDGQADASSLRSYLLHEMIEKERSGFQVAASASMNEVLGRHYHSLGAYADALIFVSRAQMKIVLEKIPQLKQKSYMIYNPIPDEPFVEARKKGVGYFGGKSIVKGFHVLVKALKSLKVNDMEAYLTMTSTTHKVQKLGNAVQLNLMPRTQLRTLMNNITLVVIPAICPEPLPYVLVECMLHGKLIVASNIGGIPEIAGQAEPGVKLVKPGDSRDIADAVSSFWQLNLDEANHLGFGNRESVLQKLDNDKAVRSLIQVIDKVCV